MDTDRAAEELKVIRQLMERPIRYSTMSGLAGIVAGTVALAGLSLDLYFWSNLPPARAMVANIFVWGGVFMTALAATLILTRMRERKQGMPFWSPVKRRILMTILPPFVAAIGLTFAVACRYLHTGGWDSVWQGYIIPAVWMLFYGVTLWQLGAFSTIEMRLLGVAFITAGLVTAAFGQWYPYMAMGITFGGFHIVYGVVVWVRHGG